MTPTRVFHAVPDLKLGLENLRLHKLRSLLTMLGMIFGVAAVVSMMSIGAGAQQQVMAFIEDLGVRNLIVEAREAGDRQALDRIRKLSAGLSFQDLRVTRANVDHIASSTARKKITPTKMLPKPQGEMPTIYGVDPGYQAIARLRLVEGRFFDARENERAAPVCVLGQAVRASIFGTGTAVGQYVKANEQWYHVIGTVEPQVTAQADIAGLPPQDRNNLIYVPLKAAMLRTEDSYSYLKDEVDAIYLQLESGADAVAVAAVVRGILNAAHRQADDFSLIVPAELLAQQRRTQRVFDMVMVALASISLLVGGIGIMNIMLATILERTREIGTRRAVGARRTDIVRQFLVETILISFVGGVLGIVFGVAMSRGIAWLAGWSTIVTPGSILLAFLVSVSVGLVFGVYPAMKAARLDPVEALHYE